MKYLNHAALCGWLLLPLCAQASLGGTVSSVSTDQTRFKAVKATTTTQTSYTDHTITQSSGTVIHEYTNSAGTVFAVTWSGPIKPDLQQLLGSYFSSFVAARSDRSSNQVSLSQLHSSQSSLVIHSSGHVGAFTGLVYVPSLVPSGVTVEDLQ